MAPPYTPSHDREALLLPGPLTDPEQILAVPVEQTVTLYRLSWKALTDIGKLGQLEPNKAIPARLSELQKWSDDRGGKMSIADRCFAGISHSALNWRSRKHWWHLPSLLVASCQAIVLIICVFSLFMGLGLPQLLFDCTTRCVHSIESPSMNRQDANDSKA